MMPPLHNVETEFGCQTPVFLTQHDLVQRRFKIVHVHHGLSLPGGDQRRLMTQIGHIGPAHAHTGAGQRIQADVIGPAQLAGFDEGGVRNLTLFSHARGRRSRQLLVRVDRWGLV